MVGERLVYSVEVGPLKAGVSQSEVTGILQVNGRSCYSIVSQTTSSGAFSVLYKVDDYLESFVDTESLSSRGIRKRIREGTYKLDSNAVYDQERRIMVSGDDTIAVPPCVQDIVSGFYYLRMLDLRPGDTITLDTYDNKKLHPLKIHVLRRERVTVKAGTFDCLVVEPVLLQPVGLFRRKGRFTMWLTDDHRKLPVLMKSEIIIGAVAVKLIEYRPGASGDEMKNEK